MKKIEINKEEFLQLYNQGLNDVEIAKYFDCTCGTILNRRKSWGLKKNFKYAQAISKEELVKYVEQGLSDYKIADITGINHSWVFGLRKKWGIERESLRINKPIVLTKRQEEILIGHVLGDGHLRISKGSVNVSGKIVQGVKQRDYAEWKYKELRNLCTELVHRIRGKEDPRTGVKYESYDALIRANPELNKYYPMMYTVDSIKIITEELMNMFTPLSLAVMYMDDGYKTQNGYCVCTNCFTKDDLNIFHKKLNEFGLDVSIHNNNVTYIKSASKDRFKELVSEYVIDSMRYKLH